MPRVPAPLSRFMPLAPVQSAKRPSRSSVLSILPEVDRGEVGLPSSPQSRAAGTDVDTSRSFSDAVHVILGDYNMDTMRPPGAENVGNRGNRRVDGPLGRPELMPLDPILRAAATIDALNSNETARLAGGASATSYDRHSGPRAGGRPRRHRGTRYRIERHKTRDLLTLRLARHTQRLKRIRSALSRAKVMVHDMHRRVDAEVHALRIGERARDAAVRAAAGQLISAAANLMRKIELDEDALRSKHQMYSGNRSLETLEAAETTLAALIARADRELRLGPATALHSNLTHREASRGAD